MKRSTAKMFWKDGHFCCKQLSHFCKTYFSFVVLTYKKCPRIRPDVLLTFNFSMALFINVSFSLFFKMMDIPEFFGRFCFQKSTIRSSIIHVDGHLVEKITHWQNLKSPVTRCRLRNLNQFVRFEFLVYFTVKLIIDESSIFCSKNKYFLPCPSVRLGLHSCRAFEVISSKCKLHFSLN